FFFAALPLVTFGSFFIVSYARGTLRESVGESLERRALQSKLDLERYVGDQIVHARLIAQDPIICETLSARAASRTPANTAGDKNNLFTSALAKRLRETQQILPTLRFIQVVDIEGRLVAATARSGRTFVNETAWFRNLAEGVSDSYVSDIHRMTGTAMNVIEIAHSVYNPRDGSWVGAVRAILDAMNLYAILAPVRIGQSGRAELLRSSDGLILASDNAERVLRRTYPGFESIETSSSLQRGYWLVPETRLRDQNGAIVDVAPARLVGHILVDQVPGVTWMVVVEQELQEAMEPVEQLTRYLWIHFIGAFASVILLSVYLSFRQEMPVINKALHLHEEHMPPSLGRRLKDLNDEDDENVAPQDRNERP
ncbi:MAG: cache domain-containing protein, partial [Vicinamibacteria bacterium]|nr:cache domain-containing protein [Vicinamibacteria bacterium]